LLKFLQVATDWWFAILASAQIPAILTVLIWGPISDIIGRKKSLLVVPIISFIQNIVLHYIENHLSLHWDVFIVFVR